VTLPWVIALAKHGVEQAAQKNRPIARAVNIHDGEVTNQPVAETFGLPFSSRFVA
jgi:alanine dehydrogenase